MRLKPTKVECTCATCGKGFTIPGWYARQGGGKYCSRSCLSSRDRGDGKKLFWSKVRKGGLDECWEWQGATTWGYGAGSINGVRFKSHRIVYEWTYGPIPKGLFVCHRCDNPPCCNPLHLFLDTHDGNMKDMILKGRGARGAKNGMSKLTEDDVKALRRRFAAGEATRKQLASDYGLHVMSVNGIIRREKWGWLEDE